MSKIKCFIFTLFMLAGMQVFSQVVIGDMPVNRPFLIQSAMNYGQNYGGYWDIPGTPQSIAKGSNIQVWDLDGGQDRQFTILATNVKNYYEIRVGNTSNARVDIEGGNKDNGASVKTWDKNNANNQKFLFKHLGNGRFKIYDLNSGKPICLAGRKNANGTNVHIWDDHDGPWMEWYLIDAQTKVAFIPQPISKNPDFFIKNKYFTYSSGTMVGHASGTASVEKIEGNKISVKIVGTNYNSDVPPGEPTEKPINYVMTITYENGKYIYQPDVFGKGEISADGKKLSFSGDAYVELTVAKEPVPLRGWIEAKNDYSLEAYMKNVSLDDIKADDANVIADATTSLGADEQPKVLMGILNGALQNKDVAVRDYIYTELGKVEFKKANGIIRMSMNAYMNNTVTKEPVQNLKAKIEAIQQKISRAK
ncbi:MAG: RICIN domain-containing protein [Bacteroidales bacterium]